MAYTKQTWADLPSKTTPINANRLTHIEDGIFNAAQTADTAASTAGTAAANIGIVSGRVETLTGRVNGLDTAVSNKVDKVAGKGLSTNDYNNTDKGKVDSLGTASTKNSTSVVTESTDLVESGAVFDVVKGSVGFVTTGKNLFDGKATSKTDQYGVTWTVDPTDNNVVTVSGTPTDVEAFRQFSDKVLPTGTYKFYGLSDTTNIAFNAFVLYQDNTVVRVITSLTTEGSEFEILSSDVYNRIGIEYKRGVNGTPCSGTIRTMITKSTVTNTAYEPYHASVEDTIYNTTRNQIQLVEDTVGNVLDLSESAVKNISGRTWSGTSTTLEGVTFTLVEDEKNNVKEILASGTASQNSSQLHISNVSIRQGRYLLGEAFANGSVNTYYTRYVARDSNGTAIAIDDSVFIDVYGKNLIKDLPSNVASIDAYVGIAANVTVNNLRFNPFVFRMDMERTKADNSVIGTVEDGTNPTKSYAVDEFMVRDGAFCQVTAPVTTSSTWTEGSNYTKKSIAEVLQSLMS